MQLLYNVFYKQFGIRRLQTLLAPRPQVMTSLPRATLIHYLSEDPAEHDIDTSKLYFGNLNKKVLVDYPELLTEFRGNPRRKPELIKPLIRPFHLANKQFRFLKDHYKVADDPLTLFVNNYSYLDVLYKYADLPLTPYNQWWNTQKTIYDTIQIISTSVEKNHFVFLDIPDELPSYNFLQIFTDKITPGLLRIFNTHNKLFILELWKWLSVVHREKSIFSSLSKEALNKVNIVFTVKDGRSVVLNLSYLNSWIEGNENLTEFSTITQFKPVILQKLFLKFLIILSSNNPDEGDSVPTEEPIKDPQDVSEEKELQDEKEDYDEDHGLSEDHEGSGEKEYQDDISSIAKTKDAKLPELDDKQLAQAVSDNDSNMSLDKKLSELDSDLSTLETMANRSLKDKGIHIDENGNVIEDSSELEKDTPIEVLEQKLYGTVTSIDALNKHVEQFAEYGLLSANDYKKFKIDIDNYSNMKDPYGSKEKTIEAMVVKPEDIQINKERSTIVASDLVKDKSMLESSLIGFDKDYVNNVLHKDILSMVDNLQKSGVVIKSHEVEIVTSVLGTYESHAIELKPIDGQVSTIRFKIPKIDPDGTFMANGNKYSMRKQRIDLPIRKIAPSSVALTSYYGKTFVTISEKVANNSLEWILKQLNKAVINEDKYITRVGFADVYDNNFKAPFMYNALAKNYKTIKAGKYNLSFIHTERNKIIPEDQLPKLETNGSILVGYSDDKEPIMISKDNEFTLLTKKGPLPLGNIFQILQLPENDAPVDFSEVRFFSKTIPVGVMLGYIVGFKNLVKVLKATHRIVEGRKNKNLESHEYGITFADVTYIFSRKERTNSLILSGFLDYEKEIKKYPVAEFTHKDVYLNLLASKGLSALYIREMELTQQLFVDPVTKSILEEMNEPTTFNGLLVRATELLLTYHHPDSQDMKAMRIRGYERVSGAIYKEMCASIRQYKGKNIAGKSKIDMSPYQVWGVIMKDPAIKIVEDINPIQNLKEAEIVTYVGEGGRGKDSMNKATRAYHVNDMGIVSEATVDSSDVGVNMYLSANPNFKDLRGLCKEDKNINPTSLMSTSVMLAPNVDKDDAKRVITSAPID